MTIKTILLDPDNSYEVVPGSQELVEAYNKTVPGYLRLTVEDQDDLNQMFLDAGLFEEMVIQ